VVTLALLSEELVGSLQSLICSDTVTTGFNSTVLKCEKFECSETRSVLLDCWDC